MVKKIKIKLMQELSQKRTAWCKRVTRPVGGFFQKFDNSDLAEALQHPLRRKRKIMKPYTGSIEHCRDNSRCQW